MTDCDKGLLMLSVAAMREWASGLKTYKRDVSTRLANTNRQVFVTGGILIQLIIIGLAG
jgi:hypothetical protein